MSGAPESPGLAEDTVSAALADLSANKPAELIIQRLRAVETQIAQLGLVRARFLRARAVATNRLGLPDRALTDLAEARTMLEQASEPAELVEVLRATALIYAWRGDGREAALTLLRAVASAAADPAMLAGVLVEAGRLQMEIGRPHDANPLFAQALAVGERAMTLQDRQRIAVSHLQALIAARKLDAAQTQADALTAALPDVPRRLSLLTWIERVRLALVRRNIPEARAALAQADAFVSPEQQSFSRVEIAQAGAELALAEGDCSKAEQLLRSVIARYGADDLAGREVGARIQRAQALAALGRRGESDRELSAALRRALQRGLVGYADQVRTMIAARGGSEHAFLADVEASGEGDGVDLSRFVRGRPLGSGGYGAVTRAYDLELGVEVAIKRFAVAGVYDVTERARLLDAARNEIAAISRIEHPGVVRVYALTIDSQGDAQLIEELIEGPSLRKVMDQSLDPLRSFEVLAEIAFALAAIHAAGVVHRDLKPDNIILRSGRSPVLVDFGLALVQGRPDRSRGAGTSGYMAPEQLSLGASVDARADLYALGVIAHELLLSDLPARPPGGLFSRLRGRTSAIGSRLSAAGADAVAADTIVRMLSPRPPQRPPSAISVARIFLSAARRRTVSSRGWS